MRKGLLLLAIISANILYSQVTINVDTPPNLVQNVLIGNGVQVSNITSQGGPNQFGSFTALPGTPIDFYSGIILSSFNITAPNVLQTGNFYSGAGTPGDGDLSGTAGGTTYDAAWIQFDFIPTGDTMKFDYIFGSVEYNNYVNSQFNDVFAFYLTGPNPIGGNYTNQNVAIVPNTNVPVTINNVNNGQSGVCSNGPCEYCQYFIDNCNPPANGIETGGYTTNLQVVVPVVPCSTYTIKLGVADVADMALNSFVMLKANSFVSNQVTVSTESQLLGVDTVLAADSVFYEGCTYTNLNFVRNGDLSGTDTVTFTVGGTATMGADYNGFSTTIVFLPGEDTIQIPVHPINDMILEPLESIVINILDTICGNPVVQSYSLFISDLGPMTISAGSDTMACPGIPFYFNADAQGGAGIFNIQWTDPSNNMWNNDSTLQLSVPGYYSVAIYEYCLDTTQYDSIYLAILEPPSTVFNDVLACSGEPVTIGTPPVAGYSMMWNPGTNLSATNISNPVFNGTNLSPTPQVFNYIVQLDSAGYQCFSDTVKVTLYRTPVVDIGDTVEGCEGVNVPLNAGFPGLQHLWNTSSTSQAINVTTGGLYYVTVTVPGTTCSGSDSVNVIIYPKFNLNLPNQQVCSQNTLAIGLNPQPGINYTWTPSTNLSASNISNPVFSGTNPGPGSNTFTYYLAVDSAGFTCSYDTIVVVLNPNPQLNMPPSVVLCESGTVDLDAGISGASYLWSNGATTQSVTVSTPGTYSVVATLPTTCFGMDSIQVLFDSLPHFTLTDLTLCQGDSGTLSVDPSEGTSFLWSTGENTSSIMVVNPGNYLLTVGNNCGSTTESVDVFIKPNLGSIYLPNILTINDDGTNDVYDIPALSASTEPWTLYFYDRWGVLLFTCTDMNNPWTGTAGAGGPKVAAGTYFMVAHMKDCTGKDIERTQFITVVE